jgi:hypothetical protein
MLVADMILTTAEGPLSALPLLPLLLFLVSGAMCSEPAQPRVRVRALEYRGPDTVNVSDPSVSVALLVELHEEPGSILRSLEVAVGDKHSLSMCQPSGLMGVTTANSTLWTADQQDQRRVLNFPLVMSSLKVSSLMGGGAQRTLPLCLNVNGEGWTRTGWIFFPPFLEAHSDSEQVASDSKPVASDSKHGASDSEHADRESDGVSSGPEVSETEDTLTGMA